MRTFGLLRTRWTGLRASLCAGLAIGASACGPERDFSAERDEREAEGLVQQAEGEELEAAVKAIAERDKVKINALLFPLLKASKECKGVTLSASYNPYRQHFSVSLVDDSSLHNVLRTVTANKQVLYADDKPFEGRQALPSGGNKLSVRRSFPTITKTQAEIFPPGEDVSLALVIKTMSARTLGNKTFVYRPKTYPGWTVELHVFSPAETTMIDDHGKRMRNAYATAIHLDTLLPQARTRADEGTPRAVEILDLLEGKKKSAEKAMADSATLPLSNLKTSLSVTHRQCK